MTTYYDLAYSGTGADEWFPSTSRTAVPGTVGGPRRYLACAAIAGLTAIGTLGAVTPADAIALSATVMSPSSTLSAVPLAPDAPSDTAVAVPETLQRLHRVSGLSWGEIAQATGVSRRTIHNWLAGKRLADVHLDRLLTLHRAVEAVEAGSTQATRDALLTPRANGRSIVDELALAARPKRRSLTSSLSVADQMTPIDESESATPSHLSRRSSLRGRSLPGRHPDES